MQRVQPAKKKYFLSPIQHTAAESVLHACSWLQVGDTATQSNTSGPPGGRWGARKETELPGEAPPTARPGRSPADSPLPQPLPAASGKVPGFPGSPGGGLTHPPGPLYSGRRNYFPSRPLPGPALQSSDKLASRGTEAPPTHGGERGVPLCTPNPSQECGAGAWTLVEPAALVLAPSLLNWGSC